jgi:hypothetical protein
MTQTPITISQLPDLGSVQGSDRLVLDRIGAAVTAGAFVVGQAYQIVSVGNTSFTAIGAESNTVGAYFVATGAGTGTGTAGPIDTGDAPVSALAALLGGDPAGTAAAAVAAHAAAADPHPGYTTPQEAAAAAPVQSVALSLPSGWSTSSINTGGSVTLTLGLPSGFSLPSNAIQATWTTGAALADTAVQEGDIRLTDSREWSAATVSQAAAEAGTSTTRAAYNPLRVFQSIAAWWVASEFKAKLDGIAAGATANATDAQLRDRSSHTGTQALSTISGLGTGIPTALGINVGTAGAPVILDGAGGTPSSLALPNATGLPLTTGVTGILPVANGGTGTDIPGLVAGTHVTITGTWPNQTISATGGGGGGGGGDGTVTSVGLSLPSQFTVTGSPVTTAGTLTATLAAQSANLVWAGPTTGAAAAPAFRSLVAGDIPTIPAGQVSGLATVATTGAYGDLSGLPTLGTAAATPATDYAPAAQGVAGGNSHNHDGGDGASIAYASLSGLPTIPSPADAAPAPLAAVAASGTSTDYAREDHVHQRDSELIVVELSGTQADPTAATTVDKFKFPWPAQILASALSAETAASGSAFIVNARLNATSIYSTLPQIAIGSTEGSSGTLSITAALAGDILRFDITQAGGGCRLAQLYLTVRRTG